MFYQKLVPSTEEGSELVTRKVVEYANYSPGSSVRGFP